MDAKRPGIQINQHSLGLFFMQYESNLCLARYIGMLYSADLQIHCSES